MILFLLYYSGLSWLFLKLNKKNKLIHVYGHRVLENKTKIDNFFIQTGHAISVEDFKKKINFLHSNFSSISINQRYGKRGNQNNNFIVSFDDGYKDNIQIAFPILKKYNIPMHIFVTSDIVKHKLLFWPDLLGYICSEIKGEYKFIFADKTYLFNDMCRIDSYISICKILKQYNNQEINNFINDIISVTEFNLKINPKDIYLSKNDIQNSNDLITFGAHSLSHENLVKLNDDDLKKTIKKSFEYIEDLVGEKINTFAYPYGIYNERTLDYLIDYDKCDYAFTTKSNFNDSNYEISRINLNISPYYAFHVQISGIFNWIKDMVR